MPYTEREIYNILFTYISDIRARILHSASPKIHGYCCQNTCKSLGKPVKWNNWTLIYWIQDATNKNWKGGMFLKLGLVISMLFMFYIFMASMSLSQLNGCVRKMLRPHSLKKIRRKKLLMGNHSDIILIGLLFFVSLFPWQSIFSINNQDMMSDYISFILI